MDFTWSDNEDEYLFEHGITIMWMEGRTKAIQKFVEALSHKIQSKCDFGYTAGRAHIEVAPDAVEKAREALLNARWLDQFLCPYSDEAYDNGNYCQIIQLK